MSKRHLAVGGLLLTVFIWGTTFVVTKVALRGLPPLTLTLLRFLLASLILVPLAWAGRRPSARAAGPIPLMLAGLMGGGLYYGLQNIGLVYTTASKASLIAGGIPALTALFSSLLLRERIGWARALGIGASVVGVAVIILADGAATLAGGHLLGDLLITATVLAWAGYTVLSRGLERHVTPLRISAATVAYGALTLLPFAAYELWTAPRPAPDAGCWLALAYLGLVATTLPFLLWNYALTQVEASEAAVYTNLVPLISVAGSVALLHETVTPGQLLGGALALVGVWVAGKEWAPRRTSAP